MHKNNKVKKEENHMKYAVLGGGALGLMAAYRKGTVAIVNAIGNGVADDKAVYAYVPAMIRYYLNEEPVLANVPTYELTSEESRQYVFSNIKNMVVKRTNQSGGYGMIMGNKIKDAAKNHNDTGSGLYYQLNFSIFFISTDR